jgi:cysteine-rich repeat protein
VETGEECDDDNVNPTDGCTAACTTCGNGVVTAPETCDDSNLTSGDGCDANCKTTGCGNGLVVAPETCDDGNTSNDDSCPSDCIVDACTPQAASNVAVDVNVTGTGVGALTILLDYPEGKVSIPGSGGSIPNGILTDYQDGSTPTPNDLDHALRNVILGPLGSDLAAGRLFRIHFESCAGAGAITSGDFACTIVAAANALGDPIPTTGLACSVAIP